MAGVIAIVLVLLLIPVIVLMSGAVLSGVFGVLPRTRRRRPPRGQRVAATRRLNPVDAPRRQRQRGAHPGDRALLGRSRADAAAAARPPAHARRAAGDGRPHRDPRWRRRARSAADLQRRARSGVHLHRPPAAPLVRAGGADRGVDPVRPRRRGVEHLRRLVGRRRRRRVRRERGVALDRRSRRPARRGRRGVRQRWYGRQPVGVARRPLEVAGRAPAGRSTEPAG